MSVVTGKSVILNYNSSFDFHVYFIYREALESEVIGLKETIRFNELQKMDKDDQIRYV